MGIGLEDTASIPKGGASLILAWSIAGRDVLVVGGDHTAASRAFFALEADASVTVVAPECHLSSSLRTRVDRGELTWFNRAFTERDLDGKSMVFVTGDDKATSHHVALLCKQRKIPVNVADASDISDFWFMSTYRDHALQIAVSTNGNGPKLASRLRRKIAAALPSEAGLAIQRLSVLRQRIRAVDTARSSERRMRFINNISEGWPLEKIAELTDEEIERLVRQYLDGHDYVEPHKVRSGSIRIIGGGNGDPDLLTRAAYNALAGADVVIADADVSRDILAVVTGDLIILKAGYQTVDLEAAALSALAGGKDVVRLVSGDASAFESEVNDVAFFLTHGFEARSLPGVSSSSSSAFPLVAGISLMKKGVADQVLYVMVDRCAPNVPCFSSTRTLVLNVTINLVGEIMADLCGKGYPADLPVAVVALEGAKKHAVKACISTVASVLKKEHLSGSATVVVGRVVDTSAKHDDSWAHANHSIHVHHPAPVKPDVPKRDVPKRETLVVKETPKHVPVEPRHVVPVKRLGVSKCVDGQTAVSHVAYGLSDLTFVYPVGTTEHVGHHVEKWAGDSVTNARNQLHKVVKMSTRTGAAGVVHGALAAGAAATALISSEALPLMIPAMYQIAHSRQPVVFHVATQAATDKYSVVSDYSDIMAASYTGFGLLGSATVQEAHDLALVAHVAAAAAQTPLVHFFDGARIARETTNAHVINYSDLKNIAHSGHIHGDLPTVVEKVMRDLSGALGHEYKIFEYVGAHDAESVVVAMGPATTLVEETVKRLHAHGKRVGLLKVRLYRPWSAHHFLAAIPKTVRRIAVIDQSSTGGSGHGPLYLDVTACFYSGHWHGAAPVIVNGRFAEGAGNFHPAAIEELFHNLSSSRPIFDFAIKVKCETAAASDVEYVPHGVHQAIFWDLQGTGTGAVGQAVTQYLDKHGHGHVQTFIAHDDAQVEPASATHIRFGAVSSSSPHLIRSADYGAVHDISLLHKYNVALSLKHGATLLINTSLTGHDFEKEVPTAVRAQIIARHLKVFTVDANKIAKDYTLFKGKTSEYVNFILKALFFKLAAGLDFPKAIQRLGEFISTSEKDHSIIRTKLGAVHRALKSYAEVHTRHWSVSHCADEPRIPAVLEPSLPFPKVPLSEEEDDEPKARHVKWHHAAWPVIFPEAYKLEKKLRPDVEGAYVIKVTENRRLTPKEYERNVFHMEMDLGDTGLKYDIGEALGVHGHNEPEHVQRFLKLYGLNPYDVVYIDRKAADGSTVSEVRTIAQMFTQIVDLFGKPGRKFYQALVDHVKDPRERVILADLLANAEELQALSDNETPTYADLLERFPSARPTVEELIELIPPIKPRHYSIASSQNVHPDSVHLLVVLVDWKTKHGHVRYGQCTRYLVNADIGQSLCVSIKPSVMKLPKSLKAPVIMSGLGTGMAPFRAFIEERAYWRAQGKEVGPMMLYFGSRNRANEYLYGEELEAYHADGLLTFLRLAFSRDQPEKVYIQHKIQEDAKHIGEYMLQHQGAFYLCGPTWPVPDVRDALITAFEHKLDRAEAAAFLEELKEEERYILEVY